jgi:hypothetical protein
VHSTPTTDYTLSLTFDGELRLQLAEKFGLTEWEAVFGPEAIMEITSKTGYNVPFEEFCPLLVRAFEQKDLNCYVDILSSQDLQNLKQKSATQKSSKLASKSNKRYLILTYMTNDQKYHYPLALVPKSKDHAIPELKEIYTQLRVELEAARAAALNDTAKTDNSFSINYDSKKNNKQQNKIKEIDQFRS